MERAKNRFFDSSEWHITKKILAVICLVITVLFLIFPFLNNERIEKIPPNVTFNDDWQVFTNDVIETENAKLPYYVKTKNINKIDMYKVIPELPFEHTAVQFSVQRKNVSVYIDENLIYEKKSEISMFSNGNPGSGTVLIQLPEDCAGKTLHISLKRTIASDNGPLNEVSLIRADITRQNYMSENVFAFSLMISLAFMGTVLLILLLFYRKMGTDLLPFFYLAIVILTLACWALCNTKMIELFASNWRFVYNLEHISFYFLPFVIAGFIKHNWDNPSKILSLTSDILLLLFTGTLLVSFFFKLDFQIFLTPSHIVMGISAAIVLVEGIVKYKKAPRSFRILCLGMILLSITVIAELINYYLFASEESVVYIFIFGFAAFSVILLLSFVLSTKERIDKSIQLQNRINIDAEHRRYEMLLSNTSDIFIDWNIAEDSIYFSKQFEPYFGGTPYRDNVLENNSKKQENVTCSVDTREIYSRILNGSNGESFVGTFLSSSGEQKWFDVSLTPVLGVDGKPMRAIGIIRDISREKLLEEEFVNQMELLKINTEIFLNVLEADITEDKVVGKNSCELAMSLGVLDQSYSRLIKEVTRHLTHKDFVEGYEEMFSRDRILSLYKNNIGFFEYEFKEKNADDDYCWLRAHVRIFKSSISQTVRIISYVKDIEEEKQKEIALLSSSQTDSLTGLLHKGATTSSIEEFLSGEGADGVHALLMIDLDYFKNVNDTLGHLVGDQVVMQVADKLRELFGERGIAGRIGGDEFMVLLKNIQGTRLLEEECDRICKAFCTTYTSEGKSCNVSISMGVSIFPISGSCYEELYRNADAALYASKSKGRNTYTIFLEEEY